MDEDEELYHDDQDEETVVDEAECSCLGGCLNCLGMSWSDFL